MLLYLPATDKDDQTGNADSKENKKEDEHDPGSSLHTEREAAREGHQMQQEDSIRNRREILENIHSTHLSTFCRTIPADVRGKRTECFTGKSNVFTPAL